MLRPVILSAAKFCSEPQEYGSLELDLALLDQRLHTKQDKAKGKALHGTSAAVILTRCLPAVTCPSLQKGRSNMNMAGAHTSSTMAKVTVAVPPIRVSLPAS